MSRAPLLLLWDIDGTLLLRAADDHRDALHHALHEVYGVTNPPRVDTAGRTDPEIARMILVAAGVGAAHIDAGLHDFRIAAARAYAERTGDLSGTLAPGVRPLLERLSFRDDVRLALLTGNLEPIARMKLRRAGIGSFFPTGQGAFGSDSEDRSMLPAVARRRAGADTAPWPRERTVVIGDTPRDIACAHADDVRCAAVGSGRHPVAELAGADACARSAHELEPVLTGWAEEG